MYLKSLEIQGFKSFPDKISLNFDKGLTAVVGPNGSGKSNIGDSVRWVLGEQSTKTLRGNKMEDVIFSGTVSRKAMGFASVTLNIDNSDKTLDGYDDTVSVTRKIYKSGESEYRINGKSVRLKDINELFMDTGLGRDGYSIIGQGRIAEIVSARSSERRDIFEEAAGISKFRYKKHEAERKLVSAQDNILRLKDIISELESRIEPLKTQSEKAEKFLELAQQQKKLEISVWVYKLNELKTKLEQVENERLVKEQEYKNVENDIKTQEEKIQDGYRKMQESTIESDNLRQKILEEEQYSSKIKSDIAVYENDILHSENTLKSITERQESEKVSKERLKSEIQESDNKAQEIEQKIESIENELEKFSDEFQKIGNEILQSGENSEKAGAEINSYYIQQNEYRLSIEMQNSHIRDAERLKSELEHSETESKKTFEDFESKKTELEKSLSEILKHIDETTNKLAGTERLYKSKVSKFEELKLEFERVLFEYKEKKQRRKILEELENNLEGFSGSVRLILKAVKQGRLSGIHGTVAQLISVDEKYATAIETVLGGAMQNIVVDNEETAKRCIRFLKEEKGGRATFLPITAIKGKEFPDYNAKSEAEFVSVASDLVKCKDEYRNIVKSLLGNTAVAEDIDSASMLAKKYHYRFRTVTFDGQLINAGGSFTGGSSQRSAGIFTRRNELENLEIEMKQLDLKRTSLGNEAEKFRGEASRLKIETEGFSQSLNSLESEKIRLETELKNISENRVSAEKNLSESEIRKQENEAKIKECQEIVKQLENKLQEVSVLIANAEKSIQRQQFLKNELNQKHFELSEKISQLKIRKTELSKDLELQQRETERLKQSEIELSASAEKLLQDISDQKKIIDEKNQLISERKKQLDNFKSNTGVYLEQIKKLQILHDEQNIYVREMQKGVKEINLVKEKILGEVTRLKERYDTFLRDFDSIVSQLLEVYELTRSEAIKEAEKIIDIQKAQKELSEVKGKIKALGHINVEAIEEYREVSERYKFLSEQLKDVESAKQELEKIIAELTDDMCRIFSESFKIINRNFKEVFRELFGGGTAELTLSDPENVLESGIEISVAPPGKVIKNLISLSGGEQAFVAIAIYFAILKLRPSPFCILDEIDAALDESNVARYAQYLKKFTDTTQFVLVTHRRSAMEEASVLYGVTMQEDGISKLLKMEQI